MTTERWPYGKPSTEPGAYAGDRQTAELAATRPWRAAMAWITPKGRLIRRADPNRVRHLLAEALAAIERLKADHGPRDHYDRWMAEIRELLDRFPPAGPQGPRGTPGEAHRS